jgi:hypothetical protein
VPILFSALTLGSIKGKQFQDTFWAIAFILPIIKKKIITPTDHKPIVNQYREGKSEKEPILGAKRPENPMFISS